MLLVHRDLIVCLGTLFLALKCHTIPVEDNEGGDSSRIVSGSMAEPGQFPFAVSLQYYYFWRFRNHICTLSLITTKTCLGAAHCAINDGKKIPVNDLCGIVGSIIQSRDVACHNYSDTVPHEKYDTKETINDIALFIFEEEIKLDKAFVNTIPLIAGTEFSSESITAIGWGNLHTLEEEETPTILRFVDLRLLPGERCGVSDDSICIETNGRGVCAGDSGGPNIITEHGQKIQVGVSSYVLEECAASISVGVAVGAYTDWIEKHSVGEPTFVNP